MDKQVLSKFIITYFVILYISECLPFSSTKTYTIESDKVCSLTSRKRHLHLGKNDASSILVKETRYFDTWLGTHSFNCTFKVEADKEPDVGVFAVIQNLSMRRHPYSGKCIDYVQFHVSNKEYSEKVCGEISIRSSDMETSDSTGLENRPYSYINTNGRMYVSIYVANKMLESGEKINLDIAFTSYKECNNAELYRSCFDDPDSSLYCIWKGFFYDGIVNCPFRQCLDEGGCKNANDDIDISHGSSPGVVTGAAVATLLIVFGSFLACIWLLRKLHLLCWSFPGNIRQTPVVEFSGQGTGDVFQPSAPSQDVSEAPQPISPDKDLPPAYDALFPPKQT